MHMFSRVATLTGGPQRPIEWATKMTEKVNAVMEVDVTLWSATFGYPGGTVAWSTIVESRAHLTDQVAKVAVDQGFLDLAQEGLEFQTGPFTDTLRSIVHTTTEPDGTPPPIGAVAEIITATTAPGKIGGVMAWGVEIADQYAAITGTPAAFLVDDYGPFGQVTWVILHEDAAAADSANNATMGNAEYMAALDGAGDLFQPGAGNRGSLVRIA